MKLYNSLILLIFSVCNLWPRLTVEAFVPVPHSPVLTSRRSMSLAASTAPNVDPVKPKNDATKPGVLPCYDELDKKLIKVAVPMIINFAITPLVGATDLFWTNRMGNALAVAGVAASIQVYNTGFWLASFLPSVTSTMVSKENAKKNDEGVQDAVCQALLVAGLIAIAGTYLFQSYPTKALGTVLKEGAPATEFALPYLNVRSLAFLPALLSVVGFSALRGILDVKTPFKISVVSSLINCVLDPILMFTVGLGVRGNAMATLLAEVVSAIAFIVVLFKRNLIKMSKIFRLPSWSVLAPLVKGGLALQLRMVAFNITFISVARITQAIDKTGVAAAAHEMALQTFQLGGVILFALSVVAQIVIPNELYSDGGVKAARATNNRMLSWGVILGTILGAVQILALPLIQKSTPLEAVRHAAYAPAILASVLQPINGLVFIGEGVMTGCGDFLFLALSTCIATAGCVAALGVFPQRFGVTGVWMGFAVFNALRLSGVGIHQLYTSVLASRKGNPVDVIEIA